MVEFKGLEKASAVEKTGIDEVKFQRAWWITSGGGRSRSKECRKKNTLVADWWAGFVEKEWQNVEGRRSRPKEWIAAQLKE